jgi:hypothetical protein
MKMICRRLLKLVIISVFILSSTLSITYFTNPVYAVIDKGRSSSILADNTTKSSTITRTPIAIPRSSLTSCTTTNPNLSCLTVTKVVNNLNNGATGLLNNIQFHIIVTDQGVNVADEILSNGKSFSVPLAIGDQFSVTEIDTPAAFITSASGACSGTVSDTSPIYCTITNTPTGTGNTLMVSPLASVTPPTNQILTPIFATPQVAIPSSGIISSILSKNCPGGLPCGPWQIFENGLVGQLNITSLKDNGKVNGTIFGHQIINGTWDQVAKRLSFIEKIAIPNSNFTLYKYDGFLNVFCDPSAAVTRTFTICTGILAGSDKPMTNEQSRINERGWLAVTGFTPQAG